MHEIGKKTQSSHRAFVRAQSMKRPHVPWQNALGQAVAVKLIREQFGQAPHGPTVLLVAQRGEQSLPERLPPVGPRSHGGQCPCLGPQSRFRCLAKQGVDVIRRQVGERRGTAPKRARRLGGRRLAKRMAQLTDWGVELILQLNHRQIGRPAVAGLPDHLQADPRERRIGVVPVLLPAPDATSISTSHSTGAARPT